jgi:Rod binding domain-containing protein
MADLMYSIPTLTNWMPLRAEGPQKPDRKEQAQALRQQCDEFSSLLYSQLFESMRQTTLTDEEGGLFGGADLESFMYLFDQSAGRAMASGGNNALSDALYAQLDARLGVTAPEGGVR